MPCEVWGECVLVPLCAEEEIAENTCKAFEQGELSVIVCRSGGELYALENRCSHQDTPLCGGRVRRGYIACPLHGVMFNLSTGEPTGQLTRRCVQTFPVSVQDGQVHIDLGDAE